MREQVYVVLTFIGTWLLYGFSLYQGALELSDQKRIVDKLKDTTPYPKVSPWYWLLPPLKLKRERQRLQQILHDRINEQEEAGDLFSFFNRATAWFYIALAGILNGIASTGALMAQFLQKGSIWLSIALDALMIVIGVLHVRYRLAHWRGQRMRARFFRNPHDN